jgi:transposase
MKKLLKKRHFIGVDISKDTLDLSLIQEATYGTFHDKKVDNSFKGFDIILEWLAKEKVKPEDCLFCMEHTGTYGLLFFAWLSQMGFDYCVEPGLKIKKSLGLTRGKNDIVDARRIADYAFTNKAKLKMFTLPSTLIIQIKQLLTYRDQLVKINSSLKNSLKSHKQYQRISGLKSISEQINLQIEENENRINQVEKQIVELIGSDPEMKKNFELATSVKGIGLVIASFMLVTTNNFTGFENGRKYACYSGIAPFEHTSGKSIKGKTKVSHLGNKKMKTLLSNGANSACTWDPEIKAYYNRKLNEGKEHKLIINSICCKLVNRVFAVVKRQTPFVNMYQQNFA